MGQRELYGQSYEQAYYYGKFVKQWNELRFNSTQDGKVAIHLIQHEQKFGARYEVGKLQKC